MQLLFAMFVVLLFPSTSAFGAACGTTPMTGAISWTTQWCDEFNGALNSPIDSTNWTFDTGSSGFGNSELAIPPRTLCPVAPARRTHSLTAAAISRFRFDRWQALGLQLA